jgi:hypothetical protein
LFKRVRSLSPKTKTLRETLFGQQNNLAILTGALFLYVHSLKVRKVHCKARKDK